MEIHPAGIKNTFLSHFVFWCVFLPILTLLFLPVMNVNTDIDPREIQMIVDAGVDVEAVSAKTNSQFSAAFIHTRIMPVMEDVLGGKPNARKKGLFVSDFAGKWVRRVFLLIYRAMWRFWALFEVYVAALIGICMPAMIDGLTVRARKRYKFENYNPVFFYFAYHAAVLVVGLLVYLPLVPVALTPQLLAGFLTCLGLAMWYAAANVQTGS